MSDIEKAIALVELTLSNAKPKDVSGLQIALDLLNIVKTGVAQ